MLYSIQIGNAAAKNWVQFAYDFKLNRTSNFQVALDGITSEYLNEYDTENEIKIYRSGVLEFRGIITLQKSLIAGGVVLSGLGIEIELTDNKSPMVGSAISRVWNSTSDHTIFSTLITSVTGWDVDVTNSTGSNLASFRTTASESVWNAVISLITQTGKDIYIDQENKKVYLYDELTRESKFSFIEGKNARNITRTKSRSKAGKVIVYGKGDGENQIIGSHGASTPVETVIDRNIISETEANARAVTEYNKLNPNPKSYKLTPIYSNGLRLGDSGQISSNSAKINEEVDLVRIKRVVSNLGKEEISIEVTNPENRQAKKTRADELNKQEANYRQSQSSMQGSGNLSQWTGIRNANDTVYLRIPFIIDERFEDEDGNLKINNLLVDYDVDPFSKEYGDVNEDNKDPDIASGTVCSDDNESTQPDEDTDYNNSISLDDSWTGYKTWSNIPDHGEAIVFHVHLWVVDWDSPTSAHSAYARIYHSDQGDYYPSTTGLRLLRGYTREETSEDGEHKHKPYQAVGKDLWFNVIDMDDYPEDYVVQYTDDAGDHEHDVYTTLNGTCSIYIPIDPYGQDFVVQLGTTDTGTATAGFFCAYYVVSRHDHSEGTYKTDEHKHNVSIGDDISDAGSLNASNVVIELEYWNGSSWAAKHSITPSPAETIDYGVDISDGGTYPDAKGIWRVKIKTNSSSADLVQAIITAKHLLNN